MILKTDLKMESKSQQILCQVHKLNIIQLNIGQNIKLGDRLICKNCSTLGQSILSLSHIEDNLFKWYQEEQNMISNQQKQLLVQVNFFQNQLKEVEKLFFKMIQKIQLDIKNYQETFIDLLQEYSQTTLSKQIQNIATSDFTTAQLLQEIAQFMSNQIIVNGQLELKEKLELNMNHSNLQIEEQINYIQNFFQKFTINKENQLSESEQLDYDTFMLKNSYKLQGNEAHISALSLSNDEELMASAHHNGQIILWDFRKSSVLQNLDGERLICDLQFSSDDKLLAAAQCYHPFDTLIFRLIKFQLYELSMKLTGHTGSIFRIEFNSNSKFLISGSDDRSLQIWSLNLKKCIVKQKLNSFVYGVSISQDQQFISGCCQGGQAYLFNSVNIENIHQIVSWKAHNSNALGTTFTPDSQMVLTSFREIKLWNINQLISNSSEQLPVRVFEKDFKSDMWRINIRMDGNILISNDGYKIYIWNMNNSKVLHMIDNKGIYYTYVRISSSIQQSDGNYSVSKNMKFIITRGEHNMINVHELQRK